jgi:hypothetical protein
MGMRELILRLQNLQELSSDLEDLRNLGLSQDELDGYIEFFAKEYFSVGATCEN